jgi:hypothetical protein
MPFRLGCKILLLERNDALPRSLQIWWRKLESQVGLDCVLSGATIVAMLRWYDECKLCINVHYVDVMSVVACHFQSRRADSIVSSLTVFH